MALTSIIPPTHILYGSDWPYVSASAVQDGVEELGAYIKGGCFCGGMGHPHVNAASGGLDEDKGGFSESGRKELAGVWRDNTERLFGWGKYAGAGN